MPETLEPTVSKFLPQSVVTFSVLHRCQIILLGVSNLPKVVEQQRPTGSRTCDIVLPPRHSLHRGIKTKILGKSKRNPIYKYVILSSWSNHTCNRGL